MRKLIVLLICFVPLFGCDLLFGNGENFPPEPDIEHYTIVINNTTHTIRVERVWDGEIYPYTIYPNQRKEIFNEIFEEDIPFFPTFGDSVNVIYDDSISVWHSKKEVQDVSRSLWLLSSYTGGKVNEKLYEIYYTFTDADYEEAVVINGGG